MALRGSLRFWLARFFCAEDSIALSSINPEFNQSGVRHDTFVQICVSPARVLLFATFALALGACGGGENGNNAMLVRQESADIPS